MAVVFIVGWQRSGSTLLDRLAGQLDGFFATGELRGLWKRALVEGSRCGCGRSVEDCPAWSESLLLAGLGPSNISPTKVAQLQDRVLRWRSMWRILGRPPAWLGRSSDQKAWVEIADHMYRSIAIATGREVLVDSSKVPIDAALLSLLPSVEPYYVHLVRDPRGVAYSWTRRKALVGAAKPGQMRTHSAWWSTLHWTAWNLAAEMIRHRYRDRFLLVRYEDFIKDPCETLSNILALTRRRSDIGFVKEQTVRLDPHHMVWGNPSRQRQGWIELTEDDEWVTAMARGQKFIVDLIAAPLLRRYGYRFSRPR